MKKHHLPILLSLCLFPIFLSSCSTRLSQTERTSIKSVSVLEPKVSPKSYSTPHGGSSYPGKVLNDVGNLAGIASDGLGGYFVGGLAGSLLGSGVSHVQNSIFRNKNREHFATLKDEIPKDISRKLGQEILKQVKSNSFFSDKIGKNSSHQFSTQITRIGLRRIGKKEGQILLTPVISGDVTLAGHPEDLMFTTVTGTATSTAGRTIDEYRAQPSLLEDDYLIAIEDFGRDLKGEINRTTR